MVAPSVPLFLHSCAPKSVISVLPFPHSHRSGKCEKKKHQTCPGIPSSVHGGSSSFPLLRESPRANFQVRATDENESCAKLAGVGRCALVSAAAAFLIQCACGEELAIAASYSPAVVETQYSSFSVDTLLCNAAAPISFTSTGITKKSGRAGGSHAKLSIVSDGVAKQSTVAAGLRKPALLVKRSGGYMPRLKNSLLARQVACSSVGVLPMASISAATLTNSVSTLTRLGLALDLSVLRSSFGTSVNLISLCTLVVWMQRSGQLPADTPVILSQVAFKLFIPCFLMSKVATTLTGSSASNLVALPLMAVAQVIVGATLGKLAGQCFFRVPSFAVEWLSSEAGDGSSSTLAVNEDQQRVTRAATKKQALITAACAFGNSLTLPLVFLSGVLASAEDANRAAGYLALYMVGWSPAMWSVGFKILTAGDEVPESESSGEKSIFQSVTKGIGSIMNPPLYGVLVGLLIGGTPLSHLFLGGQEGAVLASTSVPFDTVGAFAKLRAVTAGIFSPVFEAASLLGTATLAVQTVVLATSLGAVLPKPGEKSIKVPSHEADFENSQASTTGIGAMISNREAVLDSKAFWVISLVRLILLPFTGIFFSFVLQCCHMLPPDPIYRLVILAESAMPTAQNLVLLAQLNAGTRPLAGMLANLLLRQYALSIISLTVWMAVFLTFTPVA